jgi:hypothetical protein
MTSIRANSFSRPHSMIPRAFSASRGSAEPAAKRPRGEKVVSVNVGGRTFTTTDTTLCKSPFFVDRFDDIKQKRKVTRDNMGNLFVDRSADAFDEVLKFLRTGILPTVKYKYRLLDLELDFFRITYLLPVPEGHVSDACETEDESEDDETDENNRDMLGNLKGFVAPGAQPGKLWRKDLKKWCAGVRKGVSQKAKTAKK